MKGLRPRIAVLHGVNLDQLDRRPSGHYGDLSLNQLQSRVERFADELGMDATFFQSNHEGEFVEELHRAPERADGLILNPGAWTHYAWAIRDAVEIAALPTIEVHLSDVDAREEFRHLSVLEGIRTGKVSGKGLEGYREALALLRAELEAS